MPAKSGPQYRKMAATLGGAKTGIPFNVAKEFVAATPSKKRKQWAKNRSSMNNQPLDSYGKK